MLLSQDAVNTVVEHLRRFQTSACPVCRTSEWTVSKVLFALPEYHARPVWNFKPSPSVTTPENPMSAGLKALGGAGSPDEVFPVVPITCATCGYVYFLSAVALGLVSR